ADRLHAQLSGLYNDMAVAGPYTPEAAPAARRALRAAALALITRLDGGTLAHAQFEAADNMTEQYSALLQLVPTEHGPQAVRQFYDQWQSEPLVVDMWFSAQVLRATPQNALTIANDLSGHPDFNWKNPNRLRSVLFCFAQANPAGFHRPDGAGYAFVAHWLIKIDAANPQVAARMAAAFATWRRYSAKRQALMQTQLERMSAAPGLSRDTTEMVSRILAG
ncbi:MAG: aminopeptidase N C-terminal domain-containing protein, partial [Paracoccaceae bacterium]